MGGIGDRPGGRRNKDNNSENGRRKRWGRRAILKV